MPPASPVDGGCLGAVLSIKSASGLPASPLTKGLPWEPDKCDGLPLTTALPKTASVEPLVMPGSILEPSAPSTAASLCSKSSESDTSSKVSSSTRGVVASTGGGHGGHAAGAAEARVGPSSLRNTAETLDGASAAEESAPRRAAFSRRISARSDDDMAPKRLYAARHQNGLGSRRDDAAEAAAGVGQEDPAEVHQGKGEHGSRARAEEADAGSQGAVAPEHAANGGDQDVAHAVAHTQRQRHVVALGHREPVLGRDVKVHPRPEAVLHQLEDEARDDDAAQVAHAPQHGDVVAGDAARPLPHRPRIPAQTAKGGLRRGRGGPSVAGVQLDVVQAGDDELVARVADGPRLVGLLRPLDEGVGGAAAAAHVARKVRELAHVAVDDLAGVDEGAVGVRLLAVVVEAEEQHGRQHVQHAAHHVGAAPAPDLLGVDADERADDRPQVRPGEPDGDELEAVLLREPLGEVREEDSPGGAAHEAGHAVHHNEPPELGGRKQDGHREAHDELVDGDQDDAVGLGGERRRADLPQRVEHGEGGVQVRQVERGEVHDALQAHLGGRQGRAQHLANEGAQPAEREGEEHAAEVVVLRRLCGQREGGGVRRRRARGGVAGRVAPLQAALYVVEVPSGGVDKAVRHRVLVGARRYSYGCGAQFD
ncbi:uncharacterized protein BcabD6B2_54500 [Babesia caballi]|uniref:Uncharacterized protein n=1 Tax=Babesia caballi TaxID=5871 RepID=A0AAV4M5B2_BABCB|nr:hypothetical protein BcabD6B2_54500 [Babesia caballi]